MRRHVPAICDLEIVSAVRGMIAEDALTRPRADALIADYLSLRLRRRSHRALVLRVWELRDNFTAYDASYVALSERLGATLVTCDLRLTRAARQHTDLNVVGVG